MSKNKIPNGASEIYSSHLYGNFNNNPAATREAVITRMHQRQLTELAVNRFKWEGFPDSVDVRFHELNLFRHALSVVFEDTKLGVLLALQGSGLGNLNMVNNPKSFTVVGNNYPSKILSARDAVPVWANYLRIPDLDIVQIYSTRLAQIDRTIEINTQSARRNKVVAIPENVKLSAVNINRQLDEGNGLIQIGNSVLNDMSWMTALDLGVDPMTILNLHILRTRIWNECMGALGIENANQDKKERLVASEVDANNDQTSMTRYVNLNARRQAADAINKRFGLNVTVEYYTDAEREQTPDDETDNEVEAE